MQKPQFNQEGTEETGADPQPLPDAGINAEVADLYESLAKGLFRYLLCLVRNYDLAQEAVQETFLRYYEYRLQSGTEPAGRGWFFRVGRNYVIDQVRASRPDKHVSIEEGLTDADGSDGPHETFVHLEIRTQLSVLLSEREMECLKLRSEGFKYKEIAVILGIEPGTVGATLAHGLNKIRAFYVDKEKEGS